MFCKHCGHEVSEENAYCTVCGAYLKKKPEQISAKTEAVQFCRSCGEKVTDRYCTKCGQFNVKVEPKAAGGTAQVMDFVKQAASQIKTEEIKTKIQDTAKNLETEKIQETLKEKWKGITAEGIVAAVKEGLVFSGITVVMALIIAFICGWAAQSSLGSSLSQLGGYVPLDLGDLKICEFMMFMLLYGGTGILHVLENGELLKMGMIFPMSMLVITLLIFWIGEKIRFSLTHTKLKGYMMLIMAAVNSILTTLIAVCFSAYVSSAVKDAMGSMLNFYMESAGVDFSLDINIGHMFMTVFILSFAALLLFNAKEIWDGKFAHVVRISYRLFGMLYFMAFCLALLIGIRSFDALNMEGFMAQFQFVLGLSAVILMALLTWNLSIITGVCNNKALLSLTMSFAHMKVKSPLGNYSMKSPFTGYCILFVIIAIALIVYYSLCIWQEKETTLKGALMQSGVCAGMIAVMNSLASRMVSSTVHMTLADSTGEIKDTFGVSSFRLKYSIFNPSCIRIFIVTFVFVFIAVMAGYFITAYAGGHLNSKISAARGRIAIGACLGILIISVLSVTTFKTEKLEDSGFVTEIQNVISQLGDELSDLSTDDVMYYVD